VRILHKPSDQLLNEQLIVDCADAVPGKLRVNDAQRSIDIPGGVRTFDVSQACNIIVTGGLDKIIRVSWAD
jgi:hypothetical protein